MQSLKDFRVIEGGKGGDAGPAAFPILDIDQLRERALQLRYLLALDPHEEAVGLVDDMGEAISVLQRLMRSRHSYAPRRAAEYRALIAEIDAEILALLNGD